VIGPYQALGFKMGRFLSAIIKGGTREIKVTYTGEVSTYKVDAITASFVKGYLSRWLESDINDINAIEIAKGRGIKLEQVRIREEQEFANSVQVTVTTDIETKVVEGTLFANKDARLVKLDGVYLEVAPTEYMLAIENQDKPGVIGFLGTVLGKHGVNIADLSLGRRKDKGTALTILNVDSALNEKVVEEIKANSNILSLTAIKL
jgi:D-3-phosphoglycerate dehydrogenase